MGANPQEHAVARRLGGHPSLPLIAEPGHPKPTSSPCSAARPWASTTVADDLDLGGSSTKGLVSQGSSPRGSVAPAIAKVVAARADLWAGVDHWRPDFCGAADFDPPLAIPPPPPPPPRGGEMPTPFPPPPSNNSLTRATP